MKSDSNILKNVSPFTLYLVSFLFAVLTILIGFVLKDSVPTASLGDNIFSFLFLIASAGIAVFSFPSKLQIGFLKIAESNKAKDIYKFLGGVVLVAAGFWGIFWGTDESTFKLIFFKLGCVFFFFWGLYYVLPKKTTAEIFNKLRPLQNPALKFLKYTGILIAILVGLVIGIVILFTLGHIIAGLSATTIIIILLILILLK